MTPLELILSKTPEKKASARRHRRRAEKPVARAQKIFLGCGAKGNFLRPRLSIF
jgi:hypothetical protein